MPHRLETAPPHLRVPIALAICAGLRKADVSTVTRAAIADAMRALPASDAVQIAVNSHGQPWSESGLTSSWSTFRNSLCRQGLIGPGRIIHGLRQTLGTRLKEAGADDGMIADVLGNTIPRHSSGGAKLSQKAKGLVVDLDLDGKKRAQKRLRPTGKVSTREKSESVSN